MQREIANIYEHKAGSLINKLVGFLGEDNVKHCLGRYEKAMKSAGPIFKEYYLRYRHPWLDALGEYYGLIKKGKSIHRHLSPGLKGLAVDAKKVVTLQRHMPDCVRNKYKRDLLDMESGRSYLSELQIAWDFFVKGYALQWYEDDSARHAEYLVQAPSFAFDVECKRISVDIARKIHRKDFYGFADRLIPEIEKRNYAGRVDVILEDRLKSSSFCKLCAKLMEVIDAGTLRGKFPVAPFGSLVLDLGGTCGIPIDFNKRMQKLWERKMDNAHGAIFARAEGRKPVDPIELTVVSEKADSVLDGIKERISDAARQVGKSRSGLIVCFLEGVNGFELEKLRSESGLQLMTNDTLRSDKFSHVAGIAYCSESVSELRANAEEIFRSTLLFRNKSCKFEDAKSFRFFSPRRS